jgi:segregation and condensation protein B
MEKNELKNIIECLLFVSSKPISIKKFSEVLEGVESTQIEETIQELVNEYEHVNKPIFIQNVAGGWRMATRKKYGEWIKILFAKDITYKLSNASLETLAIVAYRQPVTIQEIEVIRGVSSGGVIRGLLEKGLVKIAGRKEALGRPVLYRTTDKFLEYFGLESISDIPPLEELGIDKEVENLIKSSDDTEIDDQVTDTVSGEESVEKEPIEDTEELDNEKSLPEEEELEEDPDEEPGNEEDSSEDKKIEEE